MGRRRMTPTLERPVQRALKHARRLGDERGVAAVEFALVLPMLVMLLFGVTTAGLAYNDNLSIANAVREGARLGAALDYNSDPTSWADSVQQRVQQVYFNSASSLPLSDICVDLVSQTSGSIATPTSQGTGCGTEPSNPTWSASGGGCAVKVWVQKPAKISLIVFPDYSFDIGAQSVAMYGLDTGACKP